MVGQSHYHYSWIDFWYTIMVALLLYTAHKPNTDLGVKQEAAAHTGRIQHHVDMVKPNGFSTAFGLDCATSGVYNCGL